ncbi:MAG: alkaline phosphatase family protein, partial [Candidatus Dormiibacterota bacterium]
MGALGGGSPVAASATRTTIHPVRSVDTASRTERPAPTNATRVDAQAAAAASAPHIMLILEENESYNAIIGSPSAPYINGLATTYRSATKWYAVQGNSPHDYLDLIVGSDLGLPSGQPYSTPTLVDELHTAGIPWRAYMENMPSNCVKGGGSSNGLYDTNHNPFIHFTNYLSSSPAWWCSAANLSSEGVVPYSGSNSLVSDLTATNAPDFVFITPNDCDEMHGDTSTGSPCAGASNSALIKAGDNWLSSNIAPVLSSTWFKRNGIVIITWDEATGDSSGCCGLTAPGGHIATIVVSANNKGLGAFTGTGDHYGTLRALEESYGVGPLLGGSSNSVNGDLTGAFGSAPTTGSIGGTVKDAQTSAGITGATVTCTCSSGGVSTGTGGSYSFANVAPGTYSMTFSQPG